MVVDRFGWCAGGVVGARFDFDEDDGSLCRMAAIAGLGVDGDDVEFTDVEVDASADDSVAAALEIAGGEAFATIAERLWWEPARE